MNNLCNPFILFLCKQGMESRININVSAVDYDKTSKALTHQLSLLEEMVHSQGDFVMTDSEFAFGWHFFVLSVNKSLVQKLEEMMGPDFEKLKGKGTEKKFLTWLTRNIEEKSPRFKLAIKEEMESSKFGIF
jgi:hypothetical protein